MKALFLCLLFFVYDSYAALGGCENGFDRYIDRQFKETIGRYFSNYETFVQKNVDTAVEAFAKEGRTRKEILQHLIDVEYLAVEGSSEQNRLFSDILSESPKRGIQTIKENPDSLYDGTLLNLPPFFLIVFIGEKEAMQASIEVDRALVSSRNPLQEVPIHYTIDPDIAGYLLLNKARPDESDKKGRVGLHNMRNPETVRVMLHYNADPMVRDRSGVPLIRYHREQVGNQEIVDLLEQARESRKPGNGTRNNEEPVINQEGKEGIRTTAIRRNDEETKRAAEVTRAEKIRKAEEAREEARKQAQVENQRGIEEQKDKLISAIAEQMTDAITMKLLVFGLAKSLTSGNFQYPVFYVQNIKTRASNIIVFQNGIEGRFEKKIEGALTDLMSDPIKKSVSLSKIEHAMREIEDELVAILKNDISHLSLAAMKRMLKKVKKQLLKFNEMVTQLLPYKQFRESFIQGLVARRLDQHQTPRPGAISEVLTEDLTQIPSRE